MEKYLEEALKTGEYLKITTRNNKELTIKVIKYDLLKVYYRFKNTFNESCIKRENIVAVKFANKLKQHDFEKRQSNYYSLITAYANYYKNYVKEIGNKVKLFDTIFDSLYTKDNNNLLLNYFQGEIINNKEEVEKSICLLLDKSNNSQKEAIKNALNHKVSVIEGPPGTGKTTTILSIIANLINENKKVIVVSKNNSAVNNIIEEFQKMGLPEFYVRYGRKDVMTALRNNINIKLDTLEKDLNNINIKPDNIIKLQSLNEELRTLEKDINDLIDVKNLIIELKSQKKFIDKKVSTYNFSNYLTENEKKFLCEKNASISKINRIIKIANKKHYNFLEKLFIKYVLCLENKDLDIKLNAIFNLLEQMYINKELALKEEILLKGDLEDKQKRVKNIYEEYNKLSLDYFLYYLKKSITISKKNITTNKELIKHTFNIYPLILTTADGFLFNFDYLIKNGLDIDSIIIDESSQCDVLTGLPLLFLAKKLIVVGDSKQLSAITEDKKIETDINEFYRYENNNFLNTIKNVFQITPTILLEHYRCNYHIINFCNKYYYDSELKIYKEASKDSISIINVDQYKGASKKDGSFINEREIKSIKENIKDINNTFIITPFKAQATLLKEEYNDKMCGTIHCFQGKGANNVYFSTVFNKSDFCEKHIKGKNNLFTKELVNVAVSRAKEKFILVCDRKFFLDNGKYVPDIKNLINYINIYGDEIVDQSNCIFDYLYRQIKYFKATKLFDNIYEKALFEALNTIFIDSPYKCYLKLRLTELVTNKEFLEKNPDILRYILNGAHADFTIIDKRINMPILVIELDGKDHEKEEQIKKDRFKKLALNASNIEVYRMPSKKAYDTLDLKEKVFSYLS